MFCEYEAGNIWHSSQKFLWPFDSECECGGYRVGVSLNTQPPGLPHSLTHAWMDAERSEDGLRTRTDRKHRDSQMEGRAAARKMICFWLIYLFFKATESSNHGRIFDPHFNSCVSLEVTPSAFLSFGTEQNVALSDPELFIETLWQRSLNLF